MNRPEDVFTSSERQSIASEFPALDSRAYLNYASVGPLPIRARAVIDRINDALQSPGRNFDAETDRAIARARSAAASLIGGHPQDVGLMPNTSAGINWALGFFDLQPRDKVLITDPEFPAVRYAASYWEQRGAGLVRVPLVPGRGLEPEMLEEALNAHPQVRVVALSWICFHNGFRHNLKELATLCHAHNAFLIVDGIQGVGTRPLDVSAAGVDVLCTGIHKWLLTPVGLGFTWCSPEVAEQFSSPVGGWMSVDWHAEYGDLFGPLKTFPRGPRAAETGTANFAGVRAMAESTEWIVSIGTDRIHDYTQGLLKLLTDQIDPDRYELISKRSIENRSSILCLRPASGDVDALKQHLDRAGVVVSVREGAIRISPHFPTSSSEIEHLVESLNEFG